MNKIVFLQELREIVDQQAKRIDQFEALRASPSAEIPSVADLVKNVQTEHRMQVRKEKNLVIYGTVPEGKDVELVSEILVELDNVKGKFYVKRIGGKKDGSGEQIMLLMCENIEMKNSILRKSRNLKDNSKFSSVFIYPDLTKEERLAGYLLRQEFAKQRVEQPDSEWVIKKGEVKRK